jgi:hypothetical protein
MTNLSTNPFTVTTSLENEPVYLTIGSLHSEKIITLKPFIDSFSLSIKKQTEQFRSNEYSPYKDVIDKSNEMSCNLSLNLVANNESEADINLKKIVMLQRMVNGSPEKTSTLIVHFSNLINSGYAIGRSVVVNPPSRFDFLKRFGVACVCNEIAYDPDLEKGMIKTSSGRLLPKVVKLSLNLNYVFQEIDEDEFIYINSFTTNGLFAYDDNPLFPFGFIHHDISEELLAYKSPLVNDISNGVQSDFFRKSMESDLKTWIFIGNNIKDQDNFLNLVDDEYENFTTDTLIPLDDLYLHSTGSLEEKASFLNSVYQDDDIKVSRYVFFNPYIESFKRTVKVTNKNASTSGNPAPFRTFYSSTVFEDLTFELKFKCPSKNSTEGKINLAKLHNLIRLFATRSELAQDGFLPNGDDLVYKYNLASSGDSYCNLCIPSFVQSANSGPIVWNTSNCLDVSFKNSLKVNLVDLTIEIDFSKGFFKNKEGELIPKSFDVSLKFIPYKGTILKDYIIKEVGQEKSYQVEDPGFGINEEETTSTITDETPDNTNSGSGDAEEADETTPTESTDTTKASETVTVNSNTEGNQETEQTITSGEADEIIEEAGDDF